MADQYDRLEGGRAASGARHPAGGADDPAAIRAEIERTRDRMSGTVDELGRRLNPDRLKSQMKRNLHDATLGKAENMARNAVYRADETRHSIMDTLRDNPLPAAMMGIGLGWLMVNARREDERAMRGFRAGHGRRLEMGYTTIDGDEMWADDLSAQRYRAGIDLDERYDDRGRVHDMRHHASDGADGMADRARELSDRAREQAHHARDRVTDIAHEARDTLRDFGDRTHERFDSGTRHVRDLGTDVVDRTRRGAGRAEHGLDEVLHDSPLAVGAAAVALGMAVGLSVPATRQEAEVLGPRRDQLFDRARDRADDVRDRVIHVAERVVDEARTTAREAARDEGLTGDSRDASERSDTNRFEAADATPRFDGGVDTPTGL